MKRMSPEDFTFEQHKMLRDELMEIVAETRRLELVILGALSAYYAWILTHDGLAKDRWVWHIPTVLAVLGGGRCLALYRRITEIGSYLAHIEQFFLPYPLPTAQGRYPLGWERHRSTLRGSPLLSTASIFWALLVLATFFIGRHLTLRQEVMKPSKEAVPLEVSGTLRLGSDPAPPPPPSKQ